MKILAHSQIEQHIQVETAAVERELELRRDSKYSSQYVVIH